MLKKTILIIAFVSALPLPALAETLDYSNGAGPAGSIRICHTKSVVSAFDRQTIRMGPGFDFHQAKGSRIEPINDVALPPKPACVTVRARIYELDTSRPLPSKGEKLTHAQGGEEVEAIVLTSFAGEGAPVPKIAHRDENTPDAKTLKLLNSDEPEQQPHTLGGLLGLD